MAGKSTARIAEQLAVHYIWTTEEKRQKINIIRGMRADELKIRLVLPLLRWTACIDNFLDYLEQECQLVEAHYSYEFVWDRINGL